MDKKELRAVIRAQKRAMTNAQIDACSEKLAALFRAHPLYQQAKSIYGYLPYNQEVRTVPMLRQAQLDGKRVAVPKVYGDEMKFLWLDDLNRTVMNGGVVIKHNANQKYTTDAVSDAIFSEICAKAGVPVQHFANRSDIPGGSTLGNLSNAHVSMNTVDIGLAQLAMHASYETAGCADVDYMIRALRQFYKTNIITSADGEYQLV